MGMCDVLNPETPYIIGWVKEITLNKQHLPITPLSRHHLYIIHFSFFCMPTVLNAPVEKWR